MEWRKGTVRELDAAMALIDQAKAFLRAQGVDQWQSGYPDRDCLRSDLERGNGYFCVEGGAVVGYLCADFAGEPAYETLNGAWLTEQPYVVVHRMALDDRVKGRGLASRAFALVEALAKERGVHSFKVDTDRDNRVMRHLLEKNGFTYCGTIRFDNSEKIAFEKVL